MIVSLVASETSHLMVCIFSVKYMSTADWGVASLRQVGALKIGGLNFSYHGKQERN